MKSPHLQVERNSKSGSQTGRSMDLLGLDPARQETDRLLREVEETDPTQLIIEGRIIKRRTLFLGCVILLVTVVAICTVSFYFGRFTAGDSKNETARIESVSPSPVKETAPTKSPESERVERLRKLIRKQ